jgi:VanZ family protein
MIKGIMFLLLHPTVINPDKTRKKSFCLHFFFDCLHIFSYLDLGVFLTQSIIKIKIPILLVWPAQIFISLLIVKI